jgi:tRNA pseudouridine55 synthase
MHSALKRDGVALYKLARQGIEVEREPRAITIFAINFVSFDGIFLVIETKVSKGTYIRVLAEDIGEALGCGAHLTGLRRTATVGYSVNDAATLEAIEVLNLEQRDQILKPADSLCLALPKIILDKNEELIFCNGGWLAAPREPTPNADEYAIYSEPARFLGVAEITLAHPEPRLIPMRLMATRKAD